MSLQPLELDYYYGGEADQFSFFRVPKVLFTDVNYRDLSIEAKMLYGILLDRMSLSVKSGWLDEENRVYIVFRHEEAKEVLGFGDAKTCKLFKELERIGLVERKKLGLGRPAIIYIKNFITSRHHGNDTEPDGTDRETSPAPSGPLYSPAPMRQAGKGRGVSPQTGAVQTFQNGKSGLFNIESQDFSDGQDFSSGKVQTFENRKSGLSIGESHGFSKSKVIYRKNNTESIKTEINDTENLSIHQSSDLTPAAVQTHGDAGWMDSRDSERDSETLERYRELIQENIGYDQLVEERPLDLDIFDGYVELMAQTCMSRAKTIRIGREDLPADLVRGQFLKLDGQNIRYVMETMSQTTAPIRNIRAYTLTALFNAPSTMSQYYSAQAGSDLARDRDSPSVGRGLHPRL